MSKSSQITEVTNMKARMRSLPLKNFRILLMVQRLPLQPALLWSQLTLNGEGTEVAGAVGAAAAVAAELPESALSSPEHSRKQQSKGESSALTACQSLPAWHFTAQHLCLLCWPLAKPCYTLSRGHSSRSPFKSLVNSTNHWSCLWEPMFTFYKPRKGGGAELWPWLLSSQFPV